MSSRRPTRLALPESCRVRLAPTVGGATLRYVRTSDGFVIDIDPVAPLPAGMIHPAKPVTPTTPIALGAGIAVQGKPAL